MDGFRRQPRRDPWDLRESYTHPDRGPHRFFRHAHAAMQRRFVRLMDPGAMPTVFLHGNPHLANYAKTRSGAAMVDFDRSRFGPFGYDLVRFLVSVSLRRGDDGDGRLVHELVAESLRRGYLLGLNAPALEPEQMKTLEKRRPKSWQRDLVRYLEKGRAWGGRLERHAIDPRQPRLWEMWQGYLASRDEEHLATRYDLVAAAEVPGSLGKLHTLLLLEPRSDELEARLVDIKEVYDEPDDEHFWHPFDHNGRRMVEAGELHAPGWEKNPGWVTVDGEEYWAREIPTQNEKLKRRLSPIEQIDLCFAVGSQLGRAHGLSVLEVTPQDLAEQLEASFEALVEAALQLRREISTAHRAYVDEAMLLEGQGAAEPREAAAE